MKIKIKQLESHDVPAAIEIWNQVVEDGVAFPQDEPLNETSGAEFFAMQSFTGVAYDEDSGEIVGLYILHPNNVGRCGHICNASYAVKRDMRGQHIGEQLVTHCLRQAKTLGFGILQFNAVVKTNTAALKLYEKLGFVQLGIIPKGFLMKEGHYEDIIPHYYVL
ncbi:MAG: GNAT family N-acetyltransferase [Eubacterium sp.]|nr:GNAT family N-acetyltransferase [Eubacterium sp.]